MSASRWIFLLLGLPGSAIAADTETLIGSIDGAKTVRIESPAGVREAGPGAPLEVEDRVRTESGIVVSVRLPDGSVMILGQGSELALRKSEIAERSFELGSGTVRGIIRLMPSVKKAIEKRSFRLIFRTRSAVMGVRGTDFIVTSEPSAGQADFFTLKGAVEVAGTETALAEGKGVPVRGGETVHATPEGIEPPKPFDPAILMTDLSKTQPSLTFPSAPTEPAPSQDPTPTPAPAPVSVEPDWVWKALQLQLVAVATSAESRGGGLEASWDPSFRLKEDWLRLQGHFGFFRMPPSETLDHTILGSNVRVSASFLVSRKIILEAGPTVQYWIGKGVAAGASFTVGWKFQERPLGVLDRLFLGFGRVSLPAPYRNPDDKEAGGEFHAGFGLRF